MKLACSFGNSALCPWIMICNLYCQFATRYQVSSVLYIGTSDNMNSPYKLNQPTFYRSSSFKLKWEMWNWNYIGEKYYIYIYIYIWNCSVTEELLFCQAYYFDLEFILSLVYNTKPSYGKTGWPKCYQMNNHYGIFYLLLSISSNYVSCTKFIFLSRDGINNRTLLEEINTKDWLRLQWW